jgi:hypothetical protein
MSSKELFKSGIKNAFNKIEINPETMKDANNYLMSFKENEKDPRYYSKLKKVMKKENKEATSSGSSGQYSGKLFSDQKPKKIETKEATTSASVGSYETPSFLAKSNSKKHWRGKSKTQIPGGKFVSIKDKCKKFPYCNQGDIKALNIYEKEYVKEAINNISKKLNLSENVIKSIIEFELEKVLKNR